MRKSSVLRLITGLFIVSLALSACGPKPTEEEEEQQKKVVTVQTIEEQDMVESSLVVSGTVVPRQFSNIRSLTPGTVEYLLPVGSEVRVGQPLFSIRDANIENAYLTAQRNLDQVRIVGNQRVNQAELNLSGAQASLKLAESNYEIAQQQAEQNNQSVVDSSVVSYNSAYNVLNQALTSLSKGSIADNGLTPLEYRFKDILTTEGQLRVDASNQLVTAVAAFNELKRFAQAETLDLQLQLMKVALSEAKKALDLTSIVLQSALVNSGVSQSTLDSYRSINLTYQTQVNQYSDAIIGAQNQLRNTRTNTQLQVEQAENQLNLARIQYDNAEIARANAVESSELEQNINQGQLASAAYNFSNLTIASPFTGRVLAHHVDVGQQVSVGQELIEVGNIEIVEMRVDVDSSASEALAIGDTVLIDDRIEGFISEIEPGGDVNSGKVGVIVQAANDSNDLVSGDIVDLKFELAYAVDPSIVIPIRSATIEETGTTVLIVEDGVVAERTVVLGRVFGNKVTVTEGLAVGDQVVIPNGIFISAGEEVDIQ